MQLSLNQILVPVVRMLLFRNYSSHSLRIWSWASYQIRKIAGCACAGNAGNVSPRRRFQMKPLVSDPGMHHGTCVTHVPWCMSGSLTCGDGENVPGIPGACAPAILRIWQEAHCGVVHTTHYPLHEIVKGVFLHQHIVLCTGECDGTDHFVENIYELYSIGFYILMFY